MVANDMGMVFFATEKSVQVVALQFFWAFSGKSSLFVLRFFFRLPIPRIHQMR